MEKNQFTEAHREAVRRFVNSEMFTDIKDAFVSHTPERGEDGREGDSDSKNLGRLLGTRYVFNQLEKIAKIPPQQPPSGKQNKQEPRRGGGRQDPDLET